jgi:GT2 family glycosyltransferase
VRLLVLIVNYRTADLTIDALASVEPEIRAGLSARVAVVDNASKDGSAERISEAVAARRWGDWVTVFPSERNGGFASGNNFALAKGIGAGPAPDYVHLLNPDTVARPGALTALVEFLDAHPTVGIAGSQLEDLDGTPQRSAYRFPNVLGELEATARVGPISRLLAPWVVAYPSPQEASPSDWVSGASMMIRREVFDAIGVFDERYFLYYEEVDFIQRARRAGWSCWIVPQSRVVHLEGQATGVTDPRKRRRRRPAYWFESRRRYFMTHLGRPATVLADLAFATGSLIWRARTVVEGRVNDTPEFLLRDLAKHSALVRGLAD